MTFLDAVAVAKFGFYYAMSDFLRQFALANPVTTLFVLIVITMFVFLVLKEIIRSLLTAWAVLLRVVLVYKKGLEDEHED